MIDAFAKFKHVTGCCHRIQHYYHFHKIAQLYMANGGFAPKAMPRKGMQSIDHVASTVYVEAPEQRGLQLLPEAHVEHLRL